MHALANPVFESAPRVWLFTRPVRESTQRPPRSRSRIKTFLHPLIAVALFALASAALLVTLLLSRGTQLYIVDGRGLEPSIPSGSLIVAEPLGDRILVVGEIITIPDANGAPVSGYVSEVIHGADGIRYSARVIGDESGEQRTLSSSNILSRVGLFVPHVADVLSAITGLAGRVAVATFAILVVAFRAGPWIARRASLARAPKLRGRRPETAG